MVKKIIKTFTFWFVVLGMAVVVLNLMNLDDMNIIMIGLNPILNLLSGSDLCDTIADVPYLWHILSLVTMVMYGLILDGLRVIIKKSRD